ncbi:MAG: type II secretion system protein GspN [Bdellovibrionales bacterium]|nr:type II secretion system protein GspN [Bdellovibrionales bacterium]
MNKIFSAIRNVLRFHKKKILFFFGSIAICLVLLFPYDDLSDFVSQKISEVTRGSVIMQFDSLAFALLPQLGIRMSNVTFDSVYAPELKFDSIGFAPSLASLFGGVGGKVVAEGLFGGGAEISVSRSNELDVDGTEFGLDIEIDNLNLKELTQFLKDKMGVPYKALGVTNLDSKIHVDPSFKVQPKGDFELKLEKFNVPAFVLTVYMGTGINKVPMSIPLPSLKISKVLLIGKISSGKIIINEAKIGDAKDDLKGTISGDFDVDFAPGGRAQFKGYDVKLNLNVRDTLKQQLGFILTFIDNYQQIGEKYKFDSLEGVRYELSLSGRNLVQPPRVSSY